MEFLFHHLSQKMSNGIFIVQNWFCLRSVHSGSCRCPEIRFVPKHPSDRGHLPLQESQSKSDLLLTNFPGHTSFLIVFAGSSPYIPLTNVLISIFRVRYGNKTPVIPNSVKYFPFSTDYACSERILTSRDQTPERNSRIPSRKLLYRWALPILILKGGRLLRLKSWR